MTVWPPDWRGGTSAGAHSGASNFAGMAAPGLGASVFGVSALGASAFGAGGIMRSAPSSGISCGGGAWKALKSATYTAVSSLGSSAGSPLTAGRGTLMAKAQRPGVRATLPSAAPYPAGSASGTGLGL